MNTCIIYAYFYDFNNITETKLIIPTKFKSYSIIYNLLSLILYFYLRVYFYPAGTLPPFLTLMSLVIISLFYTFVNKTNKGMGEGSSSRLISMTNFRFIQNSKI